MSADRVIRELGVISAPNQQLPRAIPRAIILQPGEPLGEQAAGGHELVITSPPRERQFDQLARHAPPREILLDPLRAPPHQRAAVVGESLRVAAVVEDTALLELADHLLDQVGLHAFALEIGLQLGDRTVANGQGLTRQVEGPAQLLLGPAQAAFSSSASPAGSTGISATVAPPWPMPTAS